MHKLLASHQLISDQVEPEEVGLILDEIEGQLMSRRSGAYVEFGCYVGTTSVFIARLLREHMVDLKSLHLYDSFAGLPPKTNHDCSPAGRHFTAGELHAKKSELIRNFRRTGLSIPSVHKAFFDQLPQASVPNDIRFAFMDGDFYDSIMTPLRLVQDKLAPGAVIVVDDYASEALPGAARAVHDWINDKRPVLVRPIEQRHGMAIIRLA